MGYVLTTLPPPPTMRNGVKLVLRRAVHAAIGANGAMDEWMQSGKTIGCVVAKKWRKERTLKSMGIDPDSKDGVRSQIMEAKN